MNPKRSAGAAGSKASRVRKSPRACRAGAAAKTVAAKAKDEAGRKRIATSFDLDAFHATVDMMAAETAVEWAEP